MNNLQKLEHLSNAMEYVDKDTHNERAIIKDTCEPKLKEILLDIVYDGQYTNNTGYEIAYKACAFFEDLTSEQIEDEANFEITLSDLKAESEFASIWNATRLSYLDIYNEEEIVGILKDYNFQSINQACAIWFDEQVKEAIATIMNEYILE